MHAPDASATIHHQSQPPEAMNDEQEFSFKDKAHQFVSFPTLNSEGYQFDYGNLGKTTCMWINHGPNELPQLLILQYVFFEYECEAVKTSEYKDKFARLQIMTNAFLLNILINHIRSYIYLGLLIFVHPSVLYIIGLVFLSICFSLVVLMSLLINLHGIIWLKIVKWLKLLS